LRIPWYDFGGSLRIHEVAEEELQGAPVKIILPYERHGAIGLAVAWRVPIESDGFLGWYVYVDTMTKELLWIEQLFVT
jgi:hypothetical protein